MVDMTTKMALPDLPIDLAAGVPVESTQMSPIIRLTPHIRNLIYHEVGLASRDIHRPFGFNLHTGRATFGTPSAASFYGLLLCCRAIYTEAAALLYSANRFVIYYTHPGSLGPLRSLTVPSLASLTHLKIVLNRAPCYHPNDIFSDGGYRCLHGRPHYTYSGAHDSEPVYDKSRPVPLLSGDGDGLARLRVQGMLNEWHATAAYISAHITSKLELSLVCDLDPKNGHALKVAESVTAPLRDHFPSLRICHVQLAKTADFGLQAVAREAVMAMQARGIAIPCLKPSSSPMATSLMDLPRELRLHILKYTDLIVPFREVTWSRREPRYVASSIIIHDERPGWQFMYPFYKCRHMEADGSGQSASCFCHCHHAAFSSACRCWIPPRSLFLVCRTLYQDALFVFFSGNNFFVHDLSWDPPWWVSGIRQHDSWPRLAGLEVNHRYDYPHEQFAASLFLREFVPVNALAYIRSLILVFPAYLASSWPHAGQPAMQDWWATVDWLRDKINAPRLTLRLIGAETNFNWVATGYGDPITRAEGDSIMKSYLDILCPLRKLVEGTDGLAVHVNFRYPWLYTEGIERPDQGPGFFGWLGSRKTQTNDNLKRYVMGDRYDGICENIQGHPEIHLWMRRSYSY